MSCNETETLVPHCDLSADQVTAFLILHDIARSRSSAVNRATSSVILASICVIVKIGVRQCYPTSA